MTASPLKLSDQIFHRRCRVTVWAGCELWPISSTCLGLIICPLLHTGNVWMCPCNQNDSHMTSHVSTKWDEVLTLKDFPTFSIQSAGSRFGFRFRVRTKNCERIRNSVKTKINVYDWLSCGNIKAAIINNFILIRDHMTTCMLARSLVVKNLQRISHNPVSSPQLYSV